eukprot:1156647-Pelagomonas_calceolata.AAC.21
MGSAMDERKACRALFKHGQTNSGHLGFKQLQRNDRPAGFESGTRKGRNKKVAPEGMRSKVALEVPKQTVNKDTMGDTKWGRWTPIRSSAHGACGRMYRGLPSS